jgi:hypothetical protein
MTMVEQGASCLEVFDCAISCHGDQICQQTCLVEGTNTAQQQYLAIIRCFNSPQAVQCGQDSDCLNTTCSAELEACDGPSTPVPQGTANCNDLLGCIVSCRGDNTCRLNCINSSSPTAFAQFETLSSCGEQFCLPPDDTLECIHFSCIDEWNACIPLSNNSCADTLNCARNCRDNECLINCELRIGLDAFPYYKNLVECLTTNMCQNLDCMECSIQVDDCASN